MKKKLKCLKRLLLVFLIISNLKAYPQVNREYIFELKTTAGNIISSRAMINLAPLSGNTAAIIVATPVGNTSTLNPHPTGAWYYGGKWNLFNTDHAPLVVGLTYQIRYFLSSGPNQFLHLVTKENLLSEGSFVDHPALNNNPSAQLIIFQNYSPAERSAYFLNNKEAKVEYHAATGKWYIKNVNGERLYNNSAYNIVITGGEADDKEKIAGDPKNVDPINDNPKTIVTKPVSLDSPAKQLPTTVSITPEIIAPNSRVLSPKSYQLAFDNLNDFVEKGLPPSASLPVENLDHAAVIMAQQISRSDEQSLPVLLTALQTAGFFIIDENKNILRKPDDGNGQGLAFFDFEPVGMVKLAISGVTTSLEKIAGIITKDAPELSASRFSELMLQDLRTQAENTEDKFLRFWARFIIELGKTSSQPVDLMTAQPGAINLSMLQASLLIRRLQGDFYFAKTQPVQGNIRSPFKLRNSSASVGWKHGDFRIFHQFTPFAIDIEPCNVTKEESYIMGGMSKVLKSIHREIMSKVFAGSATFAKVSVALSGINIGLSWLKLLAAVVMLRGEIIVDNPPLIRTLNSTEGEQRLMTARIWTEVKHLDWLNCIRAYLNMSTGLDFAMPLAGPVTNKEVEWHFEGDNETSVNNSETRNLQKFVLFKSLAGKNTSPLVQETDSGGVTKMYLVGAPKIPAVVNIKNPVKIEKKANVLVGVRLKSWDPSKNPGQTLIDLIGIGLAIPSIATGGVPFVSAVANEAAFRLPYVAARATIPVIDHEPCNGQWVGTVTYTEIFTFKENKVIKPDNSGSTQSASGFEKSDHTITQSGTIIVNGDKGKDSQASSSAEEILTNNKYMSGKVKCKKNGGWIPYSSNTIRTIYGSGNSEASTSVSINLERDSYEISVGNLPRVKVIRSSNEQSTSSGGCGGNKPTSYGSSSEWGYNLSGFLSGRGKYGPDSKILYGDDVTTLVGSYTKPIGSSIVQTITWNLRRCTK